jgi:flagellar motor switch protein FliM
MTQPSTIVKARADAPEIELDVSAFDFRAPDKFPRGFVRDMTDLHATFSKNLADRLGRELRTSVTIDQIGVEQLSYDGYVRSMPNPSILSIFELGDTAGKVIFEVSPQLGLMLVDRMLGGSGKPVAPRRPTELEQSILSALLMHPLEALGESLEGIINAAPRLAATELNPQFVHAAAPTEMVLVLTFSVVAEASGPATRGLISLCYPLTVLSPIREAIRRATWSGTLQQTPPSDAMASILSGSLVEVAVSTSRCSIPASELAGLAVGDVVTLEQTTDEPLFLSIDNRLIAECHLGRQGPYLATQLEKWIS